MLEALKLETWPVLFEVEHDFGGVCFGEWVLGTAANAKRSQKEPMKKAGGVPLVCVGVNDTGRLLIDQSGRIWDEDVSANSLRLRADSMRRRIEREAYGDNINALTQYSYEILPKRVNAAAGARALGLPLIKSASDAFERVWQSDKLTVWKSTDDVRVFAKNAAQLKKAVAAVEGS